MPLMPLPPTVQNAVEPMQVDAQYEDNDNHHQEHAQCFVNNPSLDLESYANNYTGLARINRLLFVFDVCPPLRLEALKMAINYVMTTYNVTLYQDLHRRLNNLLVEVGIVGSGGPANGAAVPAAPVLPDVAAPHIMHMRLNDLPVFDAAWVDTKSKQSALKLEKLDSDLKNFKSNSIKESIRRGHNDLGDHYLSCGDLTNALKCYSRSRDYCTSSKHVVNMYLNVIKVSIYQNNWSHVICHVNKAESAPDFEEEANASSQTRAKCSAGIAELMTKKYKVAAKHFLMANFDYCDFSELLSASNVAMYGGLCALATFDRQELQKHIISSSSFKLFLELEPQLRDIIFKFYESKYAACLRLLDEIRDNLLLDMYIAPHVNTLYTKIRNRALVQYFSPYLTVNMRLMASAFNCTIDALENEMMQLILDGQVQARIDSHKKIMYVKETDQRVATFERALAMGEDYTRRVRMLMLRDAIVRAHIVVKSRDTANENCAVAASTSATPARNN